MDIQEMVNKAIPIYDKDCHSAGGRKCERDCRNTIEYKEVLRAALHKRITEMAEMKKAEGYAEAKKIYEPQRCTEGMATVAD